MYAVIETGGKQYRVEVGTELEVELLDVEPGKTITIDRVLLIGDGDEASIGRPLVADASVSAEVVNQTRGPKLIEPLLTSTRSVGLMARSSSAALAVMILKVDPGSYRSCTARLRRWASRASR